ncbi:hypothetical protein Hanom_Chr03g00201281 [Helianthus anomalus]
MVGFGLGHRLTRVISKLKSQTHFEGGMVGVAWLAWPSHMSACSPTMFEWAIHSPPCQLAFPTHARLETQAPRATPQPKPTWGGGLSVFPQPKPHTP